MNRTIVVEPISDFATNVKSEYSNGFFTLSSLGSEEIEKRPVSTVFELIGQAHGSTHTKFYCVFNDGEKLAGVCESELFAEIKKASKNSRPPETEQSPAPRNGGTPSPYKHKMTKEEKQAVIIMPLFLLLVAWIGYKVIFDPENAGERKTAEEKYNEKVTRQEKDAAIQVCRNAVRLSANHPSTVDFSWNSRATLSARGTYIVSVEFEAKNSFGLALNHRARCQVANGVLESFDVYETP